jgi:iron complex outermembrane recepter protein
MTRYSKKSVVLACCVTGIGGMLTQGASAQQARAESTQLEEIIVTAEKRESTVQNTPISLTAISGADIQDRGVTDLSALVLSVPGVALRTSGPGMVEYEMRGIASAGGNSPTVGFYFDETPLTAPSATNEGKIVIRSAAWATGHSLRLRLDGWDHQGRAQCTQSRGLRRFCGSDGRGH